MLVHYSGTRNYLLTALGAAPDIFDHLLRELSEEEADFQPDPARFTLREIVAHMADWDEIFMARMGRTLAENEPAFEDHDPGQRALGHEYSLTHFKAQAHLFSQRRSLMVEFARSLTPEQWQLHCIHPRMGRVTLEAIIVLIPLHDTYHVQQVIEWRQLYAAMKPEN